MKYQSLLSQLTNQLVCKSGKFSLLASSLLVALSAQAVTLEVTTTEDQNGEDSTNCSLREAVHASLAKESYGGCEAGQNYFKDIIQLKEGTYRLDSEIPIIKRVDLYGRGINIVGADSRDYLERDSQSGELGSRSLPKTIITAGNGNRLFNSLRDGISLELSNVQIENAGSDKVRRGGAFLVGGPLELNNVLINKATANENGGAIFLEGAGSNLVAKSLLIQNSTAPLGAAISQFCNDNLAYSKKSINIENSSIVKNTATGSKGSIIYACGAQQMQLKGVTIADNQSADGALSMQDMQSYVKGNSVVYPNIDIENLTLVNNTNGMSYKDEGKISISDSVLAFNKDKDCTRIINPANGDDTALVLRNSLISGSNLRLPTNSCQQKTVTTLSATEKDANGDPIKIPKADSYNTYVGNQMMTDFFVAGLKNYGGGLLGYLPLVNSAEMLLSGNKNQCVGNDQRGVNKESYSSLEKPSSVYRCYKGSMSPATLVAVDDMGNTNKSYSDFVKRYEERIDEPAPSSYDDEQKAIYADVTEQLKANLAGFKQAFTAENGSVVRAIVVDVFANDIEQETPTSNGSSFDLFPLLRAPGQLDSADNYTVTSEALGTATNEVAESTGLVDGNDVDAGTKQNLVCRWDESIAKLVAYRKDKSVTPAGKFDWCRYEVTHKATGNISHALVQLSFRNLVPLAESVEIDTTGNELTVDISLDDLVSDEGDGPNRTGADSMFISENSGNPVFIQITKQPEVGKLSFSNGEVIDCPIADSIQIGTKKCYSGNITYTRYNTLSEFGDTFKYKVYDCGANRTDVEITIYDENDPSKIKEIKTVPRCDAKTALSSEEATVTINAVRDTEKTSVFVGGGSFGTFMMALLSLLALLSMRLRLNYKA